MTRLIYLFLLIFVSSCTTFTYCKKININKQDTQWLQPYTEGDTIIFESNLGNIKKFIVQPKRYGYTQCNKLSLGPDIYEWVKIDLEPASESSNTDLDINLKLFKSQLNSMEKWCQKDLYVLDIHGNIEERRGKYVAFDTLILPSGKLENVYFNSGTPSSSKVKTFHWSKKRGLLRFEYQNEEVFWLKEY